MPRKSAQPRRRKRDRQRLLLPALAGLALVILAVFRPTLHSDFSYDSEGEIRGWDFLHDRANILQPVSFHLMTLDVVDFNRPVAVAVLMFEAMLSGYDPMGYHLASILYHLVAAWLAFLLIRHILDRTGPGPDPAWRTAIAFLATLLFALHPLVTEAVCEPANCKDILAAIFGVGALLVAIRHRPGQPRGDALRLFLVPLLCLMAIGSKEVGAAYPPLLLLYWLLFRRGEPVKFWACIIAASFAVVAVFLVARFRLEHHPSAIFLKPPTYPDNSFVEGVFEVQPRILAFYMINILWPAFLNPDYLGYSVRFISIPLGYAMVAAAAALLAWWSRNDRRALFGTGIVVFCLLPVCNLLPIFHPAADRYLYNPLIGLALLAALGLDHPWIAAQPVRRALAILAVCAAGAGLVSVTFIRQAAWSNPTALWQDAIKLNPYSFPARTNLPEDLMKDNRLDEAQTEEEITLNGEFKNWPWAWVDYAIILQRLGDHADALKAAHHAVALKPDILDSTKMAETLQCSSDIEAEFHAILQPPPPQKK